jgi:hypothetical protein
MTLARDSTSTESAAEDTNASETTSGDWRLFFFGGGEVARAVAG